MSEAKRALHDLSVEPSARRMAEIRREADIERHLDRVDAREEGLEEGRAEGRVQGLAQGAGALRDLLKRTLETRKLQPSARQLAAVDACNDFETLRRWCNAAITAAVVDDVFG